MALSITWTRKIDNPNLFYVPASAGCVMLTDGSLVAGLMDASDFPWHMDFYRSTDNGDTWNFQSTLEQTEQQYGPRMLHWPDNILCIILGDRNDRQLYIWRSTNFAQSWSLIDTIPEGGTTANGPYTQDACTYLRSAGVAVGRLKRNDLGYATSEFYYTTDKGLNWTDGGMITPGGGQNRATCVAAKPDQNFLIGASAKSMYEAHPITTSSLLSTFPVPTLSATPPAGFDCLGVSWITDSHVVAAGFGQGGGDEHYPYIYVSTDSGASWTPVDRANIPGWPTGGSAHPGVRNVVRLTHDAVALGVYLTTGTNPTPVLVSTDQGTTWQDPNTGFGGWGTGGPSEQGGMCTTRDGSLIATFDCSIFGNSRSELWKGQITC